MQRVLLAASLTLLSAPVFAGPNPNTANGLPCVGGPSMRGRMKGPWAPDRYDGDPINIRYSPRWDIFYYAQCLDPGTPGALTAIRALVIADGKISKPGCDGGKAIKKEGNKLRLCADEADSYVTVEGKGADAIWVVGYFPGGNKPETAQPVLGGGGGGVPAQAPLPKTKPAPLPPPMGATTAKTPDGGPSLKSDGSPFVYGGGAPPADSVQSDPGPTGPASVGPNTVDGGAAAPADDCAEGDEDCQKASGAPKANGARPSLGSARRAR